MDIEGLAIQLTWTSPVDVYTPVFPPYTSVFGQYNSGAKGDSEGHDLVENIEFLTVWRVSSFREARQVFYIHQAFRNAVSTLVSSQLDDLPKGPIPKSWFSNAEHARFFQQGFSRRLTLSSLQLKSSIQTTLIAEGELRTSQEVVDNLIDLYLNTSCCLLINSAGGSHDAAIDVSVQYRWDESASQTFPPSFTAGYYPDFTIFPEVNFQPYEGQKLTIIPQYYSGTFSTACGSHVGVRFSPEISPPWLEWDDSTAVWSGTIPLFSENEIHRNTGKTYDDTVVNPLQLEMKAVRTDSIGSTYVERSLRTRLRIKVLPSRSQETTPTPQAGPPSLPMILGSEGSKIQRLPHTAPKSFAIFAQHPIRQYSTHAGKDNDLNSYRSFPSFSSSASYARLEGSADESREPQLWQTCPGQIHGYTDSRESSGSFEQFPASPTPLRRSLHHNVALDPKDSAATHLMLQSEGSIHPASAEVLALAESLQKEPLVQEQGRRQGPHRPGNHILHDEEASENSQMDDSLPYYSFGYHLDNGKLAPLTPASLSDDGSSQISTFVLPCQNPFDVLYTLRNDASDTEPSIAHEDDPSGVDADPQNAIADPWKDDPDFIKEQALLWKILREDVAEGEANEKLTVEERKQLFEAKKQSLVTEEQHLSHRLGINFSAAFTTSEDSDGDDQSSISSESSNFISNPGSGTPHASTTLQASTTEPLIPATSESEDKTTRESEIEHSDPINICQKKRAEGSTTSSSSSSNSQSNETSSSSSGSDDTGYNHIFRTQTQRSSSFLKYLPNTPQAQRHLCINAKGEGRGRGRERKRKPLMGLFGSARREGSVPKKGKCSGLGCESGSENESMKEGLWSEWLG